MKLPTTIAAICALTARASTISAGDISKWYKTTPRSLKNGETRIPRDKGVTGYDYSSIPLAKCERGAQAFDAYCHGDRNPKKYADYRNSDEG